MSPVLYPVVYVSPAGLLTVLMRYDVAVEMTLDRAIRVVNHAHKAVAATNGRGNASCIYHVAAKIYQDRTSTQLELYGGRRAKMTTEVMEFGTVAGRTLPGSCTTKVNQAECYRLTQYGLKANPSPEFTDLSQDMSVTLLFSSSGYGPHLIAQYEDVAQVCCTTTPSLSIIVVTIITTTTTTRKYVLRNEVSVPLPIITITFNPR